MPTATDPRGCPGTWRLYDNWSGHPTFSGYDVVSGYEYDNPTWQRAEGSSYAWRLVAAGTDNRQMLFTGGINDASSTLYSSSKEFTKDDPSCISAPPKVKHDCINGACLPSSTYGTPGFYESLSACEQVCGTGCSGKCISNSEWAQIENLAGQLKNRNCS